MTRDSFFGGRHFRMLVLWRTVAYSVLLTNLIAPVGAQIHEIRKIPSSSIVQSSSSIALLLNPCSDGQTEPYDRDVDIQQQFADARNSLPPGTCSSPVLAEKVFRARFLQYASLALVHDPWNLDVKISVQNQAINQCQDTHCLERELDGVIDALAPSYLNAPNRRWPDGRLCDTKLSHAPPSSLATSARKEIVSECGGINSDKTAISTCKRSNKRLISAICRMQGNQVNAPEWLFRENKTERELLLHTNDGPFGVLESICNGMPDLLTTARISAGEHSHSYYRFDGSKYQMLYGYTTSAVASSNGDDAIIALGGGVTENNVVCR